MIVKKRFIKSLNSLILIEDYILNDFNRKDILSIKKGSCNLRYYYI